MAAALSRLGSETVESSISRSSSPFPIESLQDMGDAALMELKEQTSKQSDTLSKEIEMFEKFLKRLDPKDMQLKTVQAVPSSQMDLRMQRKKNKTRSGSSAERMLKLTVEQKCDIATRELDEVREELQRKKAGMERAYDNYKAVVAEADARLTEMKKAAYEFDRDIVRAAVNAHTGKIESEKVIKYFEDRLKSRDVLMGKLALKNSSLRQRKSKLQSQLKQKEEAGEVRQEVDFEQLKIENKQYNEKFEEKNEELLKLKLSSGNTLQVLNSYKKKLHELSVESECLSGEIAQRKALLKKIDEEDKDVTKDKNEAEMINKQARRRLEDFKVPDVMEYVKERASLCELTKAVRAWERKVEIAEMALKTNHQTWRRLCQQGRQQTQHNSQATRTKTLDPLRMY